MAGFSSLIPKTSLKRAVTRAAVNLSAPLSSIPAARNRNGERASNLHKAIRNAGTLTRPFHCLLGANQTNKAAFSRVQSMSYQFVADSHSPRRPSLETEDDVQDVVDSSKKENAETPRKHQTGENNIPKKDRINFLVKTLLDIEDNKEAVYGALDAWVAWERNFPIASLKRIKTPYSINEKIVFVVVTIVTFQAGEILEAFRKINGCVLLHIFLLLCFLSPSSLLLHSEPSLFSPLDVPKLSCIYQKGMEEELKDEKVADSESNCGVLEGKSHHTPLMMIIIMIHSLVLISPKP
ncbi:hypothetical protein F2Q69_00063820 [Brassica cretica]|uniref:Uncharacterized protein n=1 Tax=Brassica cretica TaxID=69181 RepID=A0A8S9RN87_BRACR|nr:hypothetical protein F2Q69_00063820 [Brassica cretica]